MGLLGEFAWEEIAWCSALERGILFVLVDGKREGLSKLLQYFLPLVGLVPALQATEVTSHKGRRGRTL